jgi:hypothetical protein
MGELTTFVLGHLSNGLEPVDDMGSGWEGHSAWSKQRM